MFFFRRRRTIFKKNEKNLRKKLRNCEVVAAALTAKKLNDAFYYNMSHESRGYCLIFNNTNFKNDNSKRLGSEIDVDRIQKTFKNKLHFNVETCIDYNAMEIVKKIEKCIFICK